MTKQQRELESKLIMLSFKRTDYNYNTLCIKNYETKNHAVRINLDSNTYDQTYNQISTSARTEITKYAVNEIIRQMEKYASSEFN